MNRGRGRGRGIVGSIKGKDREGIEGKIRVSGRRKGEKRESVEVKGNWG